MLYSDTEIRLQLARERAELLADEMRRVRSLTPDEVGYPHWGRRVVRLVARVRSLRGRGRHVPAYEA